MIQWFLDVPLKQQKCSEINPKLLKMNLCWPSEVCLEDFPHCKVWFGLNGDLPCTGISSERVLIRPHLFGSDTMHLHCLAPGQPNIWVSWVKYKRTNVMDLCWLVKGGCWWRASDTCNRRLWLCSHSRNANLCMILLQLHIIPNLLTLELFGELFVLIFSRWIYLFFMPNTFTFVQVLLAETIDVIKWT